MNVFDLFPTLKPRSVLPAGGTPATDREYLEWRRAFVEAENARWLDRATRFGEELPGRELIDGPKFDEWLFIKTGGSRLIDNFNYSHRLRHLSICFRDRRRKIIQLAEQYARRRLWLLSMETQS